jgi:hypothetical protein
MNFTSIIKMIFAAAAVCATANASSTVFTFDQDNLGTATNFTDTVNGLSATFSSTADPGGFVIYQGMFETLTGNVLGDPGPAGQDGLALSVNFNKNLGAVSLNFATSDFQSPSPLTLTAYENGKLVGSASSTGQFPNGFNFPEGQISFNGGVFNQLSISSTATDFAVDNLAVSQAPEPAVAALFALGILGLGIPSLRSKSLRAKLAK